MDRIKKAWDFDEVNVPDEKAKSGPASYRYKFKNYELVLVEKQLFKYICQHKMFPSRAECEKLRANYKDPIMDKRATGEAFLQHLKQKVRNEWPLGDILSALKHLKLMQ